MAQTFRLPGPESVQGVQVTRDPGVDPRIASPAAFGSGIARELKDLGEAFGKVGEQLRVDRQQAQDSAFEPAYDLEYRPAATQVITEAKKKYPDAGQDYTNEVQRGLSDLHERTITKLRDERGLTPSTSLRRRLDASNVTAQSKLLSEAVQYGSNQEVLRLRDEQDKNVEAIRARVLSGDMSLEDAEQAVGGISTGSRQLFSPDELRKQNDAWLLKVRQAKLEALEAAGQREEARALRDKLYGSVPGGGRSRNDRSLVIRESGNNPRLVNDLGYAGTYQFGAPRLASLGFYTPGSGENVKDQNSTGGWSGSKWSGTFNIPGFPQVKTLRDFLATPQAQDAAYKQHSTEIDSQITSRGLDKYVGQTVGGVPITREGIHNMAHLGGIGGAERFLKSGGEYNKADKNGTKLSDYARMGAESATAPLAPNAEQAIYWERRLNTGEARERERLDVVTTENYERKIIDAGAGKGPLPSRTEIEDDVNLSDRTRNTLLRQYDAAASGIEQLQQALAKFRDPNGGAYNPFNPDERKTIDTIYQSLGGDRTALQAVVDRTGTVPRSAAQALRGDLVSPDAKVVQGALNTLGNLVGGGRPDIFAGVDGGKELSEVGHTFRDYAIGRGMGAEAATRRIMEERTRDYEAKVKARYKPEDLEKIVKDNLGGTKGINDIRGALDEVRGVPFTDPVVGFSPEDRRRALADYEVEFRDQFMRNGDVKLSKKLALEEFKKTWGVTRINGSPTVMKFTPDRAPAYAGIENVAEHVAMQAQQAILEWNGVNVPRRNLQLHEIKQTGERFVNGQPPIYSLSYTDTNGNVQVIPRPFFADPAIMKDVQVVNRAREARAIMEEAAQGGRGRAMAREARVAAGQRIAAERSPLEPEIEAAEVPIEAARQEAAQLERTRDVRQTQLEREAAEIQSGSYGIGGSFRAAQAKRAERERNKTQTAGK